MKTQTHKRNGSNRAALSPVKGFQDAYTDGQAWNDAAMYELFKMYVRDNEGSVISTLFNTIEIMQKANEVQTEIMKRMSEEILTLKSKKDGQIQIIGKGE